MKKFVTVLTLLVAGIALLPSTSMAQKAKASPKKNVTTRRVIAEPVITNAPERWEDFVNKGSDLTISMPKAPDTSVRQEAEGNIPYEATTIQTYLNQTFYVVNVRRYPQHFLAKRNDLAENFGAWLRGYILRKVEILGERQLSYGRYTMVEFVYRPSPDEVIVHRSVVIGDRLFQLIVQFPIPKSLTPQQAIEGQSERIHKFFNSFQVTEEPVVDSTVG